MSSIQFMRLPEVLKKTQMPRSTFYWRVANQEFPKPFPIGLRARAWSLDEVEAWQRKVMEGVKGDDLKAFVAKLEAARKGAAA